MTPCIESALYVSGYIIHLKFADGTDAKVDLESEIWGEVFEPLRDPARFRQFSVDKELNTITWDTGADLAPEFLYERAAQQALAAGGASRRS
jgi:hypothetical protein